MRYPIYFFLLLSGIFYLTSEQVDDKSSKAVATNGQALLPYARKIAKRSAVEETSVKPLKMAKTVVEPLEPVVIKPAKVDTDKIEQASLESQNDVTGKDRKTNVKLSKKETALGVGVGTYLANKPSFDSQPQNNFQKVDRKKLDWTVFGNSRKVVRASLPKRVPTKDQLDAAGLASDNIIPTRQLRKRRAVSRATRKSQRRARLRARNVRNARKSRAVRRKSRRYARLNKRNRNIRRIASRRSIRKPRKKVASRQRVKKFGFGAVNGVISFSTGN